MSWTTTKNSEFSPGGNLRQQNWLLDADSATLELNTGLQYVEHIAVAPASLTSTIPNFQANVLSAGTSSNGYVAVTGATSGDTVYLTVYGR